MRSQVFRYNAVVLTVILSSCFLEGQIDRFQNSSGQNPTITIDIANQNSEQPNHLGPEVRVKVIANNQTDQRVTVAVINQYAQNRPQLFKNGKLVPYRSQIAQLVRARDDHPVYVGGMGKTDFVRIQPYSTAVIKVLNLSDWYGRLEPGSYRLTNRYRFTIDGDWSPDSKALSFEVKEEK